MAKLRFKSLEKGQPSLFPENIYDRIPDNHPVRLIDKVVDELDTRFLLTTYKGGGNSAYAPKIMLKILFYAYFNNIYSSRKIAQAVKENIYFMWIARHATPDFRTINHFRSKRLKEHIHTLFVRIVEMLVQSGYVSLKKQYIDGTKIEAAANKYTFVWRKSVEKNQAKLKAKIKNVIQDIESQIRQDARENTTELPQEIDSELLSQKIEEINRDIQQTFKKKIPKTIRKPLREVKEKYLPRLQKYEEQLTLMGNRNSYSKTDRDATFMRMKDDAMKNGQLKPAYNVQISTEEQFITHYSIHQRPGDTACLISHLESFKKTYGKHSREIIADAGYGSEENYEYMEQNGMEAYVKFAYFHKEQKQKFKKNIFHREHFYYNAASDYWVCPMGQHMHKIGEKYRKSDLGYTRKISLYEAVRCEGCPFLGLCYKGKKKNRIIEVNHRLEKLKAKVRERLTSERGIYHRKKRPVEVEAVFGQLKYDHHFRRFSLRGLDKVNIEMGLMSIAHNLRKLWRKILDFPLNGNFFCGKSSFIVRVFSSKSVWFGQAA